MREPDDTHTRPAGTSDETVEAVGKLSEAFEYLVRARGHLYSLHQLIGRTDILIGEAVDALRHAGHPEVADELRDAAYGIDVIPGYWTFQLVEAFDRTYYDTVAAAERRVRDRLVAGRHHVLEAEMKAAEQRHLGGPEVSA